MHALIAVVVSVFIQSATRAGGEGGAALLETMILGDGGPVYQEIATLLVAAGAGRPIADRDGGSPLAHAERRGFYELAAILRRDINK